MDFRDELQLDIFLWGLNSIFFSHLERIGWRNTIGLSWPPCPPHLGSGCWPSILSRCSKVKARAPWQILSILFSRDFFGLHPWQLTWNPKMAILKMIFLFKEMIFRFHVMGCRQPKYNRSKNNWIFWETPKHKLSVFLSNSEQLQIWKKKTREKPSLEIGFFLSTRFLTQKMDSWDKNHPTINLWLSNYPCASTHKIRSERHQWGHLMEFLLDYIMAYTPWKLTAGGPQNDGPWNLVTPALNMAICGIYLKFLEYLYQNTLWFHNLLIFTSNTQHLFSPRVRKMISCQQYCSLELKG